MPGINGRRKGNSAELEVARMVEFWWLQLSLEQQASPDGHPCEFIRTPSSGGWATRRVRGNYRVAGDIGTTSDSWPFTVEVKRRERWTLRTLVKGQSSPVWSWWQQCATASEEESGIPMLWLRRNKMPWMVLLPEDVAGPILGITNSDIYWPDRETVALHQTTGIHPIGYLADKLVKSDPRPWLAVSARKPRPALAGPPGLPEPAKGEQRGV
jgi:hypothetical protein